MNEPKVPDFPNPAHALHRMHENMVAGFDPLGVAEPLLHAQLAWMTHPQELADQSAKFATSLWQLQWHTVQRTLGQPSEDPVRPHADDTRFADPVWHDSATWDLVKEWYLLTTHSVQDMLYDTPGLSNKDRRRAAFWWRKWLNMMAPSNIFWTNPVAMRKALETRGQSLVDGMRNFLADMAAGEVRMTDPTRFKVGVNIATAPGSVIFRNELLEVIHYAPTQKKVHAVPVVFIMPWINKFYVLDLNAKKSMVRWLVDQGLDVYITSWKNPDASMRDTNFDDYLIKGVDTIVRVVREYAGVPQVHAVGYCIGGTALSMYMAWANRPYGESAMPVAHWTTFTTMIDFHKPGDIEVFIDEASVNYLTGMMARRGFLDGREMATAFRLLRSNSLIWHYVVHGWLYGEALPPFDVLFWNMDSTRMPAAMHTWYLNELYLKNRLIQKDALVVAGQPLDLEAIVQPLYAVAAEDDHIAPWQQAFRITHFVVAPKRFVLSSSGHILGIVNPPVDPPKRSFRASQAHRAETAQAWPDRTPSTPGSWWDDWMAWLKPQAGKLVAARPASDSRFPELVAAPGSYVLET